MNHLIDLYFINIFRKLDKICNKIRLYKLYETIVIFWIHLLILLRNKVDLPLFYLNYIMYQYFIIHRIERQNIRRHDKKNRIRNTFMYNFLLKLSFIYFNRFTVEDILVSKFIISEL